MIKNEIRKAGGLSGRGWGHGRGRGGRGFGNYRGAGDFSMDYNEQHRKDTLELARMRQRVSSLHETEGVPSYPFGFDPLQGAGYPPMDGFYHPGPPFLPPPGMGPPPPPMMGYLVSRDCDGCG